MKKEVCLALAALLVLGACSARVERPEVYTYKTVSIGSLVVAPYFYPASVDVEAGPGGDDEERRRVVEFLTRALHHELTGNAAGVRIADLSLSLEAYEEAGDGGTYARHVASSIEACRRLGADGVVTGVVDTFQERQGGELGVTRPATVRLVTRLYECSTGEVVWEDYFNETQKSLFQNLLEIRKFMERQGKWITARQLALEGVRRVVSELELYFAGK